MKLNRAPGVGILLLLALTGCGNSQQLSRKQVSTSQSAYTDAIEAFQAKEYAAAIESFDSAIDEEGLDADQLGEALLRRADCHIELGNLDEAAADLEMVEGRATDLDQFHLVRCKLYARQGDVAKAQTEFEEARKINPQIERPAALN